MLLSSRKATTTSGNSQSNYQLNLGDRSAQARDAYRKNDVSGLGIALFAYKRDYGNFPGDLNQLATANEIRISPTPPLNSIPLNTYGYKTCIVQGVTQAIIYTKLESTGSNGHYFVFRTQDYDIASNKFGHSETSSSDEPSCP